MGDRMNIAPGGEQGIRRPGQRKSTPDRRRWNARTLAIGTLLLAGVAAGSWRLIRIDGSRRDGASPSPTPTASPRISQPPSPMPTAVVGASAKSQRDFEAIYTDLQAVRQRAYKEHLPELLDHVYSGECTPQCPVAAEKKAISDEAAAGAYTTAAPKILLVQVLSDRSNLQFKETNRSVKIRIIDSQDPYPFLDKNGAVIGRSPGWAPTSRLFDLHFSPTRQRWLIWNYTIEGSGDKYLPQRHSSPTSK